MGTMCCLYVQLIDYLITKNRLPSVNSSANFLALNNNTGMYIADKQKHRMPMQMHSPKAVSRWTLDWN